MTEKEIIINIRKLVDEHRECLNKLNRIQADWKFEVERFIELSKQKEV